MPSLKAEEASWLSSQWGITSPVHASVPSANSIRRQKSLVCHLGQGKLPGTGYCHLGRDTYVACPELAVLQLAKQLKRPAAISSAMLESSVMRANAAGIVLAVILSELMGTYRLSAHAPDGFVPAEPLVTLEGLRKLQADFADSPGSKAFGFALEHALEGSASPAETALALFETLPRLCGGMGLAQRPLLNSSVQTSFNQHTRTLRPDQLFASARVIVEYNGSYHEGERANSDDRRRIELENAGYKVKSVNCEQLFSAEALEETLAPLAEEVGVSGRCPSDYTARRRDLRALVFGACATRCREFRRGLLPEGLAPGAS
ncbi:MAG: DUF559 domain-containing protein [Coriobacteriales bacterium]